MISEDLNKIKEVRICFDWERMIIPQNFVKHLSYNILSEEKYYRFFCDIVNFTLDLNYAKTHKYYMCNDIDYYKENNIESDSSSTMYERLQNKDIWYLEIVFLDGTSFELNPPTNRKDYYSSEKKYLMAWDAPNVCEVHSVENQLLKIKWYDTKDYMDKYELKIFLKNENLWVEEEGRMSFGIQFFEYLFRKYSGKIEKQEPLKYMIWNSLQNKNEFFYVSVKLKKGKSVFLVFFVICYEDNCQNAILKLMQENPEDSYWVIIGRELGFSDFSILYATFDEFNEFWLQYKKQNELL